MADESARGFPSSAFSQAGFQLGSILDLELLTIRERERIRKAPIPVRVDLLMCVYRENLCDVIALDTALSLVDKAIAIEKKPRSFRGRVLPPDIYYSPKHEERAQNPPVTAIQVYIICVRTGTTQIIPMAVAPQMVLVTRSSRGEVNSA